MNADQFRMRQDHHSKAVNEVREIFSVSPFEYKQLGKRSDSTRGPAPYDLHLAKDLRLRRVAYCPGLAQGLRDVAETAIKEFETPNHPLPMPVESADEIRGELKSDHNLYGNNFGAEPNVAAAYPRDTAEKILSVASVLAFKSPVFDRQFFYMTNNVERGQSTKGKSKKNYAIPDASLTLDTDHYSEDVPLAAVCAVQKVTEYFDHITLFEFKSLSSGSYDAMLSILFYAGPLSFLWEECKDRYCAQAHGQALGRKPVTGDARGYDALKLPIKLTSSELEPEVQDVASSLGKKSLEHGHNILQQVWAEAVKHDATFVVVHGGNWEIITVRERKTQTLFVSNIVKVSDPEYFKLHIGLYIASFRDAEDRAAQLARSEPTTWTQPYDLGYGTHMPEPTPRPKFADVTRYYPQLSLQPAGRSKKNNMTYVKGVPYKREIVNAAPLQFRDPKLCFQLKAVPTKKSNTFIGTLSVCEHKYKEPVVIRTAQGRKASKDLQNEYRRHQTLSRRPTLNTSGIQEPYGFFTFEGSPSNGQEEMYGVLILQYVADSGTPISRLAAPQRKSLLGGLGVIHSEELILGNLDPGHFIVDKNGEAWLVDLRYAKKPKRSLEGSQRKEERGLKRLLAKGAKARALAEPLIIGPVEDNCSPRVTFDVITSWMGGRPWLEGAHCSINKEGIDSGTYLDVRFTEASYVVPFMYEWSKRPEKWLEIVCMRGFCTPEHSQEPYHQSTQGSQDVDLF